MLIAGLLFSLIGLEGESHKFDDLLEQFNFLYIFILAVIIAPIFEEILFRYYINKPSLFVYGFLTALLFFIVYASFSKMIGLYISIPLAFLVIYVISQDEIVDKLTRVYKDYFPYFFYFGAVLFAYVHIFNFDGSMLWYHTPLLVFPQFFLALYLGYIRIRNGIQYSIFVHALNNCIPMLIMLLVPESFISGG